MKCPVCLKDFAVLEKHHITPICYGGPVNGPLVDLCSSCHHDIHKEAESVTSKSKKNLRYFNPDDFERAKKYIIAIIMAKQQFDRTSNPNNRRKLTIELTDSELTKLHKMKQDAGYKNMEQYLHDIILRLISTL